MRGLSRGCANSSLKRKWKSDNFIEKMCLFVQTALSVSLRAACTYDSCFAGRYVHDNQQIRWRNILLHSKHNKSHWFSRTLVLLFMLYILLNKYFFGIYIKYTLYMHTEILRVMKWDLAQWFRKFESIFSTKLKKTSVKTWMPFLNIDLDLTWSDMTSHQHVYSEKHKLDHHSVQQTFLCFHRTCSRT